jgi:hypothetical protein
MRLFGLVDGLIDRRDRAQWLTPPFDRRLSTGIAGPYRIAAAAPQSLTAEQGQAVIAGSVLGAAKCQ